jgi:hypothetical protein
MSQMNNKLVVSVALAVGVVAGSFFIAQAQGQTKVAVAAADTRIDKIIEQNDKVLKNQDEILKQLADLKEGVLQIRRRSS